MGRCAELGRDDDEVLLLDVYHFLASVRSYAKFMPSRLCSEAFVIQFNPTVLLATSSNGEIDMMTHSPAKVEAYMCKGSRGSASLAKAADELEERGLRQL